MKMFLNKECSALSLSAVYNIMGVLIYQLLYCGLSQTYLEKILKRN